MNAATDVAAGTYLRWSTWARGGALGACLLLLAIIAFETVIAPAGERRPNVVVWVALSLPLLIFLPGLWRGGLRSYAWLSFVSLLYFAQAITALFGAPAQWLPIVSLLASVALFVCTLLFVRWRARAERGGALPR